MRPGGGLIVEPWFTSDSYRAGNVFAHAAQLGTGQVCRVSLSGRKGDVSILSFHYLRVMPNGIGHHSERVELGLFTRDEMTWAFEAAGLEPQYDPEGLMCRGLYVAKRLG
ncbi:MAG TPA: hypothetical protein VJ718_01990 [Candidatus Binataceae bacterium]|nr:hypothetical protein [Candidatus Binataceae bacterium]